MTDAQDLNGLAEALSCICTRAGLPASATEQIIGALSGGEPAQKGALLEVLGAVGGEKALASVRAGLKDPEAEVRDAAVRTLADWPDSAAAPDLLHRDGFEPGSENGQVATGSRQGAQTNGPAQIADSVVSGA